MVASNDVAAEALVCVLQHPTAVRELGAAFAAHASDPACAATLRVAPRTGAPPELSAALREAAAVADEARVRGQFACVSAALLRRVKEAWPWETRARDGARARICHALLPLLANEDVLQLATPALLRLCAAEEPPFRVDDTDPSLAEAWATHAAVIRSLETKIQHTAQAALGRPVGRSAAEARMAHALFGSMQQTPLRNELLVLAGATREESGLTEAEEAAAKQRLREEVESWSDEEADEEEVDEEEDARRAFQAATGFSVGGSPVGQQLAAMLAEQLR